MLSFNVFPLRYFHDMMGKQQIALVFLDNRNIASSTSSSWCCVWSYESTKNCEKWCSLGYASWFSSCKFFQLPAQHRRDRGGRHWAADRWNPTCSSLPSWRKDENCCTWCTCCTETATQLTQFNAINREESVLLWFTLPVNVKTCNPRRFIRGDMASHLRSRKILAINSKQPSWCSCCSWLPQSPSFQHPTTAQKPWWPVPSVLLELF